MEIRRSKKFDKMFCKLDNKIQIKVIKTLENFILDPFDKVLNNHWLTWEYKYFRSINVTWDYRIIFLELSDGRYELVELYKVWTHGQLY